MQNLIVNSTAGATLLFEHFLRFGIRAALLKSEDASNAGRVSIILTARHQRSHIDHVVEALDEAGIEASTRCEGADDSCGVQFKAEARGYSARVLPFPETGIRKHRKMERHDAEL